MNRMRIRFLILLWALLLAAQCADAQEAGPTEYQLKTAFLYNFAKFIEWPADSGSLNFCILGEDNFGRDIDSIEGKAVGG